MYPIYFWFYAVNKETNKVRYYLNKPKKKKERQERKKNKETKSTIGFALVCLVLKQSISLDDLKLGLLLTQHTHTHLGVLKSEGSFYCHF